MGGFSIWHLLAIVVVLLLLFGRGRITNLMGDLAQGIKSFKRGMADEHAKAGEAPKTLTVDAKAESVKDGNTTAAKS